MELLAADLLTKCRVSDTHRKRTIVRTLWIRIVQKLKVFCTAYFDYVSSFANTDIFSEIYARNSTS